MPKRKPKVTATEQAPDATSLKKRTSPVVQVSLWFKEPCKECAEEGLPIEFSVVPKIGDMIDVANSASLTGNNRTHRYWIVTEVMHAFSVDVDQSEPVAQPRFAELRVVIEPASRSLIRGQ